MENIAKSVCHLVADLLDEYDVRHIVVSPGSRNAPLITVLERKGCFRLHPVVDERTAAFVGLGMALRSAEPVALVCTSGTAV
ncbi:MAG: 2-succinyl-5-enolpyruvyl-6-hydroxy-3-cyclohexene-1-carboxylic-acid synthase, partial [Bacteroidales bacterium]|nr:2-succinyl-5-enolpyruvyl-6-hydroxy-3-cyclohexene-1-carboxylic-acid synthase [Bacteroidales bacterium]